MRIRSTTLKIRKAVRRPATALIVAVTVLIAACGDSRDASQGEETVPRITPAPTVSTVAPPTQPPTVLTDPPTTVPATVTPTAPATPWPTPLRTDPPTNPPTASPTNPPATQGADPPSPPPVAPAPTAPTTAAVSEPTSTLVVNPESPETCGAEAIGADTGDLTIANVSCNAGWAIGRIDECPAGADCEGVDVFHVTGAGWVHDGYFFAVCAEGLTGAGMSIYTAATFVSNFCEGEPGGTAVIKPDSTGERVVQLQTALVAEGYQLSADGTYGPRTQAAVRDFQTRNGLEVDGIAGPQTQAALGIGPGGSGPTSPTTATPTVTTSPTASTSIAASTTTIVLTPSEPAACTAEAIGAETGTAILDITACQSGWALGRIESCPAQTVCEDADIFHVTENGWVYDGNFSVLCGEDLTEAGMSPFTAAELEAFCGEPDPPAQPEIIRPDSTGNEVRNLQVALIALGYPIAADGTYGPRTQAAVRDYQAASGLVVDGIAGPQTRLSLGV